MQMCFLESSDRVSEAVEGGFATVKVLPITPEQSRHNNGHRDELVNREITVVASQPRHKIAEASDVLKSSVLR